MWQDFGRKIPRKPNQKAKPMKLVPSMRTPGGSSSMHGAGRRFVAVLACVLGIQSVVSADTAQQTTNAVSQFNVTIDGRFTPDSIVIGRAAAAVFPPAVHEWSDVVPQAFIADLNTGALFRTTTDDPNANSFVYTSLDPGVDALYLMYDFVGQQTDPSLFAPGQVLGQVSFGVHLPPATGEGGGGFGGVPDANGNTQITVKFKVPQFVPAAAAVVIGGGGGFNPVAVDIVFDVAGGQSGVPAFLLPGLEGAASFGSSPNSATAHFQAELGVGLRIPPAFSPPAGPFPAAGVNPATGLYDPAPKFWGSGFGTNAGGGGGGIGLAAAAVKAAAAPVPAGGIQSASANLVTISPTGSVNVNSGPSAGPGGFVPFAGGSAIKIANGELIGLRSQLTGRNLRELNEAIDSLGASMSIGLFTDPARPNPVGGSRVFSRGSDAVDELSEILRSRPALPNALIGLLRDAAGRIVGASDEFAITAIQDAIAAGKDPRIIAAAKRELAEGDRDAARGNSEDAIEEYGEAWAIAIGSRRGDHD